MFKKHSRRIVISLIILLISVLYTLPSTPLWVAMFGSLSEGYQSAVPQKGFTYETVKADNQLGIKEGTTNLIINLNTTSNLFKDINQDHERVLFDVATQIRQVLLNKKYEAKIVNTVTNVDNKYYVVLNTNATKDQIEETISGSNMYAKFPLMIASLFPEKKITLGLDLRGGLDLVYQVDIKSIQDNENQDTVDKAVQRSVEIIRNRIDLYGIAEPSIRQQNDNRIRIQIPGTKDPEKVKQLIQSTAMLKFHIVKEVRNSPTDFVALNKDTEIVVRQTPTKNNPYATWYRLNAIPDVEGKDLTYAQISFDELNRPYVSIRFNNEGARRFADVTRNNRDKQLAIVLDGNVYSAPVIKDTITGGMAQITGQFSVEDAQSLAIVLQAGALPATLTALESRVVGPTLGQKSIRAGLIAGLVGFVLVMGYMMVAYKSFGIYADIALIFNSLIVFALLVYFGGTMTLPGIAGFILAIGMAVDANVIIFERIKEEYKAGKTVRASIASGFDRAFTCILDSNITTLIVVAILYNFSTGPIRGFATTLGIGLVANLYTAVVVTKLLLDIKYGDGKTQKIHF